MAKTMIGYDTSLSQFDSIKYIRQLRAVVKWKNNKARATIEAATGFGKSAIALIVIAKLFKKSPELLRHGGSVLVVVPTITLQKQWLSILKKANLKQTEVLVINTVALQEGFTRNVDLLILDEIHLFAADKFVRIFSRVGYTWLLGLTATMDRLDGKHRLLQKVAPICDTITQKEAILRGWISDFIEFNLAVPITRKESEEQVNLGKTIRYYMSRFGDFDKMLACMDKRNASQYVQFYNHGRPIDQHIQPSEVVKWATLGLRAIHKRKNFLDTTEHKIKAAIELIKEFDVRTITFSQSTTFADTLAKNFDKTKCTVYHSNIASEIRVIQKKKAYKSKIASQKAKLKLEEQGYDVNIEFKSGEYVLRWKYEKSVSGIKIANENIQRFLSKQVNILTTAKALDQGFDDDTILLGIDASRSESPTQHTQRTGRVARNLKLPDGSFAVKVYVNLYIPDWSVPGSRDEQKLRKCQSKNFENVVWVDDFEQLREFLDLILNKRAKQKGDKKFIFESLI
jgi:superfamily II DNA or RNA helicase